MTLPNRIALAVLSLMTVANVCTTVVGQDPSYIILRQPNPSPTPKQAAVATCHQHGRTNSAFCPICGAETWMLDSAQSQTPQLMSQNSATIVEGMIIQDAITSTQGGLIGSAREGYGDYPIHRVYRKPYAYGWFGASPSPMRSRSSGYYGRPSRWTFQ